MPRWKFDLLRDAILHAAAAPVAFKDLSSAVGAQLSDGDLSRLGSLGWHVTTVKLELEVRGELKRLSAKGGHMVRAVRR